MDVVVTGADTELGRVVAEEFQRAGHHVVVVGADAEALNHTAEALQAAAVVCDTADPAGLSVAQAGLPYDIDAVVVVPPPAWISGDPRSMTLTDTAVVWRSAFDRTVVSAVLTVQAVGDHLRSGGSVVTVVSVGAGAESGPDVASKAALSAWTAAQADRFGVRGITVNAVASGQPAPLGYDGLTSQPLSVSSEIARLALFLTTPAARHITGQTLHVGRGTAVTYR